jgi:hypothetical protein
MSKEVTTDGQTLGESTKLTLTVKTLIWIMAGLFSLFGYFYVDMRLKLNNANDIIDNKIKEEMVQYKEDVTELKGDVKSIEGTVNKMEVSIGILLDRSTGDRNSGTSNVNPSDNIPITLPTNNGATQ